MPYLSPVLYFGLGNMLDGHLKAVGVAYSGIDNPKPTLAQDVMDLVGLLEAVPGVHHSRVASEASTPAAIAARRCRSRNLLETAWLLLRWEILNSAHVNRWIIGRWLLVVADQLRWRLVV